MPVYVRRFLLQQCVCSVMLLTFPTAHKMRCELSLTSDSLSVERRDVCTPTTTHYSMNTLDEVVEMFICAFTCSDMYFERTYLIK